MKDGATKERNTLSRIEQVVERMTGLNAKDIRDTTLDEQRSAVEKKHGKQLSFTCAFPFIGRGNVMRDRTKSREEINRIVDSVLK